MNPAFTNLGDEKKNKIIQACLEEFAERGYEKASTNSMVEKAGISKGLLFHYFGNKKNLYLYLLDISMDFFTKRLYSYDLKTTGDLFERVMHSGIIKIKIAGESPLMYKLVMDAFINMPDALKVELNERYQRLYAQSMPGFFESIDYSLFRDEIDKQKAIEFLFLCFDALYNKYVKLAKDKDLDIFRNEDLDRLMQEYAVYMDMIKFGIYKKD